MKRPLAAMILPFLLALGIGSCGTGGSTTGSGGNGGDGAGGAVPPLSAEELKDPKQCQQCHPTHYQEWSGSMHAYAAEDPVFLAMNARGQRETQGALGAFCVNCHAPLAVRAGATKDGLNLAEVDPKLKGVTCYFCHSVTEVTGAHNNPLNLTEDGTLRAGVADPVKTGAHASAHSSLHDRDQLASASMCGSCHDIETPNGTKLERTFAEWQGSIFAHPPTVLTCGQCHMDGKQGLAADVPGVPLRRIHSHMFPGVDVALTDFPEAEAQRAAVQASLDTTLQAVMCVKGQPMASGARLQVVLDNVGAGHHWPSGSTQDRRAWVEVVARTGGQVTYQSGVVKDGESVIDLADPDLWLIRDCLVDDEGKEVHMFWEASSYESNQLPGPVTSNPTDPAFFFTHIVQTYPRPSSVPSSLSTYPDEVSMRVRLVPIGLDVLDDLITSKDLDPSIRAKMPVFTLASTVLTWKPEDATIHYLEGGIPVACVTSGLATGANAGVPAPAHTKCSP